MCTSQFGPVRVIGSHVCPVAAAVDSTAVAFTSSLQRSILADGLLEACSGPLVDKLLTLDKLLPL